jgi:hypothetical protein
MKMLGGQAPHKEPPLFVQPSSTRPRVSDGLAQPGYADKAE